MNWEAIGAIGEIFGAIAVFATLVYLALQIRQSTSIAIASSEISIRENFGPINAALYSDPELCEILIKAEDSDAEFSRIEDLRLMTMFTQLVNIWISTETAYKSGLASKPSYETIFDNARFLISAYPATKSVFERIFTSYPAMNETELFKFMRGLLEE